MTSAAEQDAWRAFFLAALTGSAHSQLQVPYLTDRATNIADAAIDRLKQREDRSL